MNNYIKNIILTPFHILYKVNPVLCTKVLFRLKVKQKLDLKHPITFNQKIQWIKLYDKEPLKPKCVDKYTVRKYIKKTGCEELLNELFWEGYHPEDIPFDKLPDKYVIKVTHGQGMNIICKDTHSLDGNKTAQKMDERKVFALLWGVVLWQSQTTRHSGKIFGKQ